MALSLAMWLRSPIQWHHSPPAGHGAHLHFPRHPAGRASQELYILMGIYGNIWEYDIFTMGIHQTLLDIMGTICIYIYIHICTMGINRIYQYHESIMGFGD